MKCKTCGMLALSLGLALSMVAPTYAVADRTETERTKVIRGTNNGENGYWLEYITRTFRFVDNPQLLAIRDIFQALNGREPTQAELDQWAAALKGASAENIKSWNSQLVALYQSLLGRKPTSAELLAALQRLASGTTLDTLSKELYAGNLPAVVDNEYKSRFGVVLPQSDRDALIAKINAGSLTLEQLKAGLTKMKTLLSYDGYPANIYNHEGHVIDFDAIDAFFGDDWDGRYGDKKDWLYKYNKIVDDAPINKIGSIPNTTSCFVELSRVASLLQLVNQGMPLPSSTLKGEYYAYGSKHTYSVASTKAGILAEAKAIYTAGISTSSPIAFDLNHDGKIGVTGKSTAANRNSKNAFVANGSVLFDLRGCGKRERFEWLNKDGDGFLVYDRGGFISKAAQGKGEIDGNRLFGDAVGYDHGYEKLALRTGGVDVAASQLQNVPVQNYLRDSAKGNELKDLKVWIDSNGDAYVQPSELKALDSLGITEVGLRPEFKKNKDNETVILSYFVQNGKKYMAEDVWFATEPKK